MGGFGSFIDALNDVLQDITEFQGGTKSQRNHLNRLVFNLNALRDAVRASHEDVDGDGGKPEPGKKPVVPMEDTKLLLLNESGVAVLYRVKMKRAVI
jgi:hypothetical protein